VRDVSAREVAPLGTRDGTREHGRCLRRYDQVDAPADDQRRAAQLAEPWAGIETQHQLALGPIRRQVGLGKMAVGHHRSAELDDGREHATEP
jgi:hypothetical protein